MNKIKALHIPDYSVVRMNSELVGSYSRTGAFKGLIKTSDTHGVIVKTTEEFEVVMYPAQLSMEYVNHCNGCKK